MHEQKASCAGFPKASGKRRHTEEATTRKRIKGKATMARALQRKAMDEPGQLSFEFEG